MQQKKVVRSPSLFSHFLFCLPNLRRIFVFLILIFCFNAFSFAAECDCTTESHDEHWNENLGDKTVGANHYIGISADISITGELKVDAYLTLDLMGHTLYISRVYLCCGDTLKFVDSVTVSLALKALIVEFDIVYSVSSFSSSAIKVDELVLL